MILIKDYLARSDEKSSSNWANYIAIDMDFHCNQIIIYESFYYCIIRRFRSIQVSRNEE